MVNQDYMNQYMTQNGILIDGIKQSEAKKSQVPFCQEDNTFAVPDFLVKDSVTSHD